MIACKFDLTIEDLSKYEQIENIKEDVLSPADIQCICFQNDNVENCISDILLASQI